MMNRLHLALFTAGSARATSSILQYPTWRSSNCGSRTRSGRRCASVIIRKVLRLSRGLPVVPLVRRARLFQRLGGWLSAVSEREVRPRIDRVTIDPHLEMHVRPVRASGHADTADNGTRRDRHAG